MTLIHTFHLWILELIVSDTYSHCKYLSIVSTGNCPVHWHRSGIFHFQKRTVKERITLDKTSDHKFESPHKAEIRKYCKNKKLSKKRGIYNIETVTALALHITILNQHYLLFLTYKQVEFLNNEITIYNYRCTYTFVRIAVWYLWIVSFWVVIKQHLKSL